MYNFSLPFYVKNTDTEANFLDIAPKMIPELFSEAKKHKDIMLEQFHG